MAGLEIAMLAGAGFLAGAVNAVAGGGSLISFPALLAAGYSPVTANVTNALAVLPGYAGGSLGYRRELRGQGGRVLALTATSVAGAVAGAVVLLTTPAEVFEGIVPFLILGSCAVLAAQPLLARWTRPRGGEGHERAPALHAGTFAGAFYGGYFSAGVGILLLALLAMLIDDELQRLNALKGLLSLVIGAAAAVAFALFGPVAWGAAALMAVASLAGGRAGVGLARRLPARELRALVIAFGVIVALVLLW